MQRILKTECERKNQCHIKLFNHYFMIVNGTTCYSQHQKKELLYNFWKKTEKIIEKEVLRYEKLLEEPW